MSNPEKPTGPGSGRYTRYTPVKSERNTLLKKLFNDKAGDKGEIYGREGSDPTEIVIARVKDNSTGMFPSSGHQSGDPDMFPNGVNLDYSGTPDGASPPEPSEITWKKAGDPIGAFMPDTSSPGPGKTDGTQKEDPGITQEESYTDVKGKPFVSDINTASPKISSKKVSSGGTLGQSLEKGKS